jgi:hypothetical protein
MHGGPLIPNDRFAVYLRTWEAEDRTDGHQEYRFDREIIGAVHLRYRAKAGLGFQFVVPTGAPTAA